MRSKRNGLGAGSGALPGDRPRDTLFARNHLGVPQLRPNPASVDDQVMRVVVWHPLANGKLVRRRSHDAAVPARYASPLFQPFRYGGSVRFADVVGPAGGPAVGYRQHDRLGGVLGESQRPAPTPEILLDSQHLRIIGHLLEPWPEAMVVVRAVHPGEA